MKFKNVKNFLLCVTISVLLLETNVHASILPSVGAVANDVVATTSIEGSGEVTVELITPSESPKEEDAAETEKAGIVTSVGAGELLSSVEISPEDMDEQEDSEEDAAGGSFGYTNLGIANVEDHLNVRATADDNSKIVGKMSKNTACEILGFEGNKAHITSGSVEGYVSTDFLLMGSGAVDRANSVIQNLATVKADGLKLRENPSTDAPVVGMVAYGEELAVVSELDGWVQISYDGAPAYVSAEFVSVDRKLKTALNMTEFLYGEGVSNVRVELCEYAKQFIGNPYVWGGVSLTKGADCSGFVLSVYAKYGIGLPHSSRAQANMGTSINMSEAKPGDLVFYAKGGRINHVAIYIGGGQVCHASSPKTGIRVSSAYYRTPVKVVRLLQD
ncbi:MAG: NlpC/P60 family protein [Roseburia sp.]|nr:NlpC/P60 family protein [Roseburia sp.]MCM1279687.1 NlpC/P60 family protein [Robinsoniella sp.]